MHVSDSASANVLEQQSVMSPLCVLSCRVQEVPSPFMYSLRPGPHGKQLHYLLDKVVLDGEFEGDFSMINWDCCPLQAAVSDDLGSRWHPPILADGQDRGHIAPELVRPW